VREVDEDVVHVSLRSADNLQSIEDVSHQPVSLRHHILGSGNLLPEAARSDNGAQEVALVALSTLTNSLVNVNVAVLREDRLDVEL
jgi:hypothetical protein